jgi:hypothetical protein
VSGLRRQIGERDHRLGQRQAELARRFVAQDTLHMGPIERLMAQAAVERVLWLEQVDPQAAAALSRRAKRPSAAAAPAPDLAPGLVPVPEPLAESAEQQAERLAAESRQQEIERKLEHAIDRMLTEQIGRRRRPWWQRWRN